MKLKTLQQYALRTSLAMANPFGSVIATYPNCILKMNTDEDYYLGVKDSPIFSSSFIEYLDSHGFHQHTIDKASHKGRGIDIDLKNPITGSFMTGSSSGTALNIFHGINDIGVGSDGGGSVLSPAASLNLIGFIHPKLGKEFINHEKYLKNSTDGISFTPSVGFISKKLDLVKNISGLFIGDQGRKKNLKIAVDEDIKNIEWSSKFEIEKLEEKDFSYKYSADRRELIQQLESLLTEFDLVISKEGPIDTEGIGETLFGHFDDRTKEKQILGNKGFVRVVNMCNAIGLIVPSGSLATGYLIIGRETNFIEKYMFELGEVLIAERDQLIDNYFLDSASYFQNGYRK